MKTYIVSILIFISMFGCIETDIVDSEMVDESIVVTPNSGSLSIGEELQLTGLHTNMFGIQTEVEFDWIVEDSNIITIESNGLAKAVGPGQTVVNAKFGTATSNDVLINVVSNANDIASVIITPPSSSTLELDATLQLNAKAYNITNNELEGKLIIWTSSDTSIVTIDDTGLLRAISMGSVLITATSEGVQSEPIAITIGTATRTAVFMGVSGYTAEGSALLRINELGDVILELSPDFKTSFALGTFIYLSNSITGSTTRSSGLELGQISSNGEKSFNVTAQRTDVDLDSYMYVIVLCKPASITFGTAEFN